MSNTLAEKVTAATKAGLNPFATASVATSSVKKAKKNEKAEIQISGLRDLAVLDTVEKTVKSLKENVRIGINAQLTNHFADSGAKLHRQPENFRGVELDASASCELRKRSDRSVLNDQEIALLESEGIPFSEIVDREETFIINPAYAQDAKLLGKVGTVLGKIPGMPADFIQKQTAVRRTVVSDESLPAVFAKDAGKIAELLAVVGVLAVKPKLEATDISEALDAIKELIAE
jgi:hypothetical protein